jgi:predicted ATP-dependent endonuclease of OLD family
MKLRRIEIQKFRCIDAIDIEVNNISILIGENNSGKSKCG